MFARSDSEVELMITSNIFTGSNDNIGIYYIVCFIVACMHDDLAAFAILHTGRYNYIGVLVALTKLQGQLIVHCIYFTVYMQS